MSAPGEHMDGARFRELGHAMVDLIADYHESISDYPVACPAAPGDVRKQLPTDAPRVGEDFAQIFDDVRKIIIPGLTHWQSPNFFAYFPSNVSGPSMLGEFLSAGLGVQGMSWATSPACTELESHVLDWLVDMLGLPRDFKTSGPGGGVIQDTASSATLCALLAARARITEGECNRQGTPHKLVLYTSEQAHSSVEKAVRIAGIGTDCLRRIAVDTDYAMDVAALAKQIHEDLRAGLKPFFVCATLGTTSSNAFDPIADIGTLCARNNLWLHLDAAMSGTAFLCPEFRHLQTGIEHADSYCFNPHKWMFTNFDCDCFYVRQRRHLLQALSILPEYLRNQATEAGSVIDYRDWHIPLGRRFRALKLWFVIRHYGISGLQRYVREHIGLAQELARWIDVDDRFERVAPAPLNLVCFRLKADDAKNETLLQRLNDSGALYLTHTRLKGQYVLRICIGQTRTTRRHVQAAWDRICTTADALRCKP